MKVIVAMSGGVDSSVAAYLLKKKGFEVIGLSFELWDKRDLDSSNACCSVKTIELAKSVAQKLGVEHYTVDVRDVFYRNVIESFCESYLDGRTPNPCILCNKHIKFDFLLQKADELGADFVATGHYARVLNSKKRGDHNSGLCRNLLLKGIDARKDQSYVLYVMTQEELSKSIFPLGDFTKVKTRKIAKDIGLVSAMRPESQEICFVGNDTYADFIKEFSPDALKPGPILNMKGSVVGKHKGIAFYTIGQRRRLGISSPYPNYVVDMDPHKNAIIVSSRDDAMKKSFKVKDINWISIEGLYHPISTAVKIRSTMKEAPSTVSPSGKSEVEVKFETPQWAPAPGQSAVFYKDDIVIGGGVIG